MVLSRYIIAWQAGGGGGGRRGGGGGGGGGGARVREGRLARETVELWGLWGHLT